MIKIGTRRKKIEELLKEGYYSIAQLSKITQMEPSVILEDLKHISTTTRVKGYSLKVTLIYCYKCGERISPKGLHYVSRCPKCGSTHIERPRYHLQKLR